MRTADDGLRKEASPRQLFQEAEAPGSRAVSAVRVRSPRNLSPASPAPTFETRPKKHSSFAGRASNLRNIDVPFRRDKLTVIPGCRGRASHRWRSIHLRGRAAPLRRVPLRLRATVPRTHGEARVDSIEGLSPAISIEQKSAGHNPRSTVGTVTEIYDYLRLLFARVGTPHCPNCGRLVQRQSAVQIAETVLSWPEGTRIEVLAPLVRGRKGEFRDLFESVRKQGFIRAVVDGEVVELATPPKLNRRQNHSISVIVDRLVVRPITAAAYRSLETALSSPMAWWR